MMMLLLLLWTLLSVLLVDTVGTTRFVLESNGKIEARRQIEFHEELEENGRLLTMEELADVAFLNLPNAQPKKGGNWLLHHAGIDGSNQEKQFQQHKQQQQQGLLPPEVVDIIIDSELEKRKDLEGGDRVEFAQRLGLLKMDGLSNAALAYLYDDVKLPTGQYLRERQIDQELRHRSTYGYDAPDWDRLHTAWDHLRGIQLRNNHGVSHAEGEIEAIFRKQGGVYTVRSTLERKILQFGRGKQEVWTTWNQLGNTFRATGEVHHAIQCFRRALFLKPEDPDILLNIAVVLQNLGFISDAEVLIRTAVSLNPRGVLQHFIFGNILNEQGKVAEAIKSYRTTLKLQPDFIPVIKALHDLGVQPDDPALLANSQRAHYDVMEWDWYVPVYLKYVAIVVFAALGVYTLYDSTESEKKRHRNRKYKRK